MPGKRSNGEGALRKRSSGLWECMIMTGFQPNGKREYKSFYARTRKEVFAESKGLPGCDRGRPGHDEEGAEVRRVGSVVV